MCPKNLLEMTIFAEAVYQTSPNGDQGEDTLYAYSRGEILTRWYTIMQDVTSREFSRSGGCGSGVKTELTIWRNLRTKITIANYFPNRHLKIVPDDRLRTHC